jgi:hypothetical protein
MKQPKADPQTNPPVSQARPVATIRPSEPAKVTPAPPVLAVVKVPEQPRNKLVPPPNAIVLFKPTIMLGEYMFIGKTQEKKLTPELAWIAEGAIVIDEMGIIVPLAGNHVLTTVTT